MDTAPNISNFNKPMYPVGGRFARLAKDVLGIEGGHANHAADKGGETNYGISLRFLKLEGKIDLNSDGFADFDLDFDGDIDGADIRLLTPVQAGNLFYRCFWNRAEMADLPQPIDGAVLDQAVNGGIVASVKMLQKALNRLVIGADLVVDGNLGPKTKQRVLAAKPQMNRLIFNYRQEAEARYNELVRLDSTQVVFLDGWVKRARRLGHV
ncbi:glycoside hydrolase family 108 protein [Asticcacaulis sp. YBE204]|uniref:glycoside hydrolase family 108 protein n=1 Tax=Asticcacaulis sp. YBE204 TaxID=1282363 RepID=UPI0003C40854|nr:glycosyl hydrolase 108 family protein [Asticcacaulis sp. YBE204]ESQ78493.1 hypothetical protein AEYBE204_13140 [Asticcacaulis sp. YBE204]